MEPFNSPQNKIPNLNDFVNRNGMDEGKYNNIKQLMHI